MSTVPPATDQDVEEIRKRVEAEPTIALSCGHVFEPQARRCACGFSWRMNPDVDGLSPSFNLCQDIRALLARDAEKSAALAEAEKRIEQEETHSSNLELEAQKLIVDAWSERDHALGLLAEAERALEAVESRVCCAEPLCDDCGVPVRAALAKIREGRKG